jgi:uncharacterized protein
MSQVPPSQPPPPGSVPPAGPPGGQPLPPDQERLWAMLAHLLSFVAAYIALGIAYVVLVIVASVRANSGQFFRYPLTIRFIR